MSSSIVRLSVVRFPPVDAETKRSPTLFSRLGAKKLAKSKFARRGRSDRARADRLSWSRPIELESTTNPPDHDILKKNSLKRQVGPGGRFSEGFFCRKITFAERAAQFSQNSRAFRSLNKQYSQIFSGNH
ncbi:MAG: hypothetical protein LBJ64_00535 [Deltaproteobacteria bacterium]|jgi:hypothetical protein|nr:hypothetical protein [Deltaproteobacteria bacterium]